MKEKRSKRKAAAAAANRGAVVVVAHDARAAVVASVAAFLESAGLPRRLAALQSEAGLEVSNCSRYPLVCTVRSLFVAEATDLGISGSRPARGGRHRCVN